MFRFVSTVVLSIMAATASAADTVKDAPRPPMTVATFEALDRNADHQLSRSEAGFDRVLSEVFADVDVDGDGYVTKSEFTVVAKKSEVASR